MSTLEQPDGEPAVPAAPSDPAAAEPHQAPTDPDELEQDEQADPAVPEPDPADPTAPADPPEGSTLERPSPDDPFDADEIAVAREQVRHAPRYGRFATVGGLLGLVVAFLLTPFAEYDEPGMVLDPWGLGLLLVAILIPIGILIGCILALVADRRSRRARR